MEKESKTNVTLRCTRKHNKILIKLIKYCRLGWAVATSQKDVETRLNGGHNLPLPPGWYRVNRSAKRCGDVSPARPFSVATALIRPTAVQSNLKI